MKRNRSNIILLLVLALLVGALVVYIVWDRGQSGTEDPADESSTAEAAAFVDLDEEEVSRIVLDNQYGQYIFEAVDTIETGETLVEGEAAPTPSITRSYELTAPEISRPDADKINSRAKDLLSLPPQAVAAESAGDISVYGLDDPQARVEYLLEDGSTIEVLIGSTLRNEDNIAYAKLADEDRVVTISSFLATVDISSLDLMQTQLVPFDSLSVRSLRFERANDGLIFEAEVVPLVLPGGVQPTPSPEPADDTEVDRDTEAANREWAVLQPAEGSGNNADIASLLQSFVDLEAESAAAETIDDPAAYGLDEPAYAMTLRTADTELTIKLGSEQEVGRRYAEISGHDELYIVKTEDLPMIDRPTTDLYNAFFFLPNINTVGSAVVETPEGRYEMTIFNPTQEEEEADETVEAHYTINGQDATVEDSSGDSYFTPVYQDMLSIMRDGLDVDADPDIGDAEYHVSYTMRVGDLSTTSFDLVQRDQNTFYVFMQGDYTGFYVDADRIDHDSDNPDELGLRQEIQRLLTAMEKQTDGIYDFPDPEVETN